LNDLYESYISDLESRNMENVEHFKQLLLHESEIMKSSKNPKNYQELTEYKESIMAQIDCTLPPHYIPKPSAAAKNGGIIEPYSELKDYLDKDDFGGLLDVLGQFAGKTSSGLMIIGESLLDRFAVKSKKKERTQEGDAPVHDVDDYVVPG
jgi:hypothetical protein